MLIIVWLNNMNKEEKTEEQINQEDIARLVVPHHKKSRKAEPKDIERIVEESKVLYRLCFTQNGLYKGAFAMHHSQIEEKDPIDFFVTAERKIVINPNITKHSNYKVDSNEGCASFPNHEMVVVQRWRITEVEYVSLIISPNDKDKFVFSGNREDRLTGHEANIFQHEADHANGIFIHKTLIK